MKPSYQGFKAQQNTGFLEVPPVGQYVAKILNARFVPADGDKQQRDVIELFIDIVEGEYKGRYMELYNDQKERFGDNVVYKGLYRLTPPVDGDEDWKTRIFEGALWCVEQSNNGYHWDWEESKLKDKLVGINVRQRLYTYNGKDKETTEIGKFETVDDVRNGKCKDMKPNDRRSSDSKSDDQNFTDVSDDKSVSVPW